MTDTTNQQLVCTHTEAAIYLRQRLGPIRRFDFFVRDCTLGKGAFSLDVEFKVNGTSYYSKASLDALVAEVAAAVPAASPGVDVVWSHASAVDPMFKLGEKARLKRDKAELEKREFREIKFKYRELLKKTMH